VLNLVVHIVTTELQRAIHCWQLSDDLSEVLCRSFEGQIFSVFH